MKVIVGLVLALAAWGQGGDTSRRLLPTYVVANLPQAAAGTLAVVTDAAAAGNCTAGGGKFVSVCRSTGRGWEAFAGRPGNGEPRANCGRALLQPGERDAVARGCVAVENSRRQWADGATSLATVQSADAVVYSALTASSIGIGTDSPNAQLTFGPAAPNGTVMKFQAMGTKANSLGYNLVRGAFAFDPNEPEDEIMALGYNIANGGGRESALDSAIAFALEGSYNVGGAQYTEAHLLYVDKQGFQRRPWSWRINKNDPNDWVNLISASSTVYTHPVTGVPYLQFSPQGFQMATTNSGGRTFAIADDGNVSFLSGGGTRQLLFTSGWSAVQLPGVVFYPTVTAFTQPVQMGNSLAIGPVGDISLSRTGASEMSVGNGGSGVSNGKVRAQQFIGTLVGNAATASGLAPAAATTPASSTAVCTPGMVNFDAQYAYFCVSTNNWKRAALASW
jgi:hypothetical protein